eukprot:scaffold149_cov383-Prasinococcus_capsulatus_cf.AAC.34
MTGMSDARSVAALTDLVYGGAEAWPGEAASDAMGDSGSPSCWRPLDAAGGNSHGIARRNCVRPAWVAGHPHGRTARKYAAQHAFVHEASQLVALLTWARSRFRGQHHKVQASSLYHDWVVNAVATGRPGHSAHAGHRQGHHQYTTARSLDARILCPCTLLVCAKDGSEDTVQVTALADLDPPRLGHCRCPLPRVGPALEHPVVRRVPVII